MRASTSGRRPTASAINLTDIYGRPSLAPTNPLHNIPTANPMASTDGISGTVNGIAAEESITMLYDSILVYFNPYVFAQQLVIHLLPFGFLLSPNMLAQGFTGSWIGILFHIIQPLVFYTMISTYPFSGASRVYINGCLWIAVIYFLEQKIMLSVKYACLTPSEYERIMTCQDANTIAIYQEQMNLISSWLEREDTVLQFELGAASIRVGINMSHVYFSLPGLPSETNASSSSTSTQNDHNITSAYIKAKETSKRSQFHFWNAFLRGHSVIDTFALPAKEFIPREVSNEEGDIDINTPGFYLSISDFCSTLIRRSDEINYMNIRATKGIVSHLFLVVLIPVILLFVHSQEVSIEVLITQFAYILIVNTMTYSFGFSVQRILYTSLFDVLRQLHMMRDLSRVIRLSDLELPTNVNTRMAKLAVNKNEQIEISARNVAAIMNLHQQAARSNILNRRSSHAATARQSGRQSSIDKNTLMEMEEVDSLLDHIGERIAEENAIAVVPRLSFQDVHNITSWTYSRLILQNFGERYRFRMDLYVGGTIVLFVIMAIIVFVHVYLSPHRLKTLLTAFIMQTLLSITSIFLLTLSILYSSSLVNEEMNKHNQLLRRHVLLSKHLKQHAQEVLDDLQDLQQQYVSREGRKNDHNETLDEERKQELAEAIERQEGVVENYDEVLEQLETSIDVLESENEQKPFRIFGMPADISLVMTVLSAILSYYGAIISLFAANNPLVGDVGAAL